MHELFNKVLAKRDLSRAGDLFSVPDADIVDDITEVVGYSLLLSKNRISLLCFSKSSPRLGPSSRMRTM